jgi:hypothetical protein
MIVRYQRTQPNRIAASVNLIYARNAGNVDQHLDAGALSTLQLDQNVRPTRDHAGTLTVLRQKF